LAFLVVGRSSHSVVALASSAVVVAAPSSSAVAVAVAAASHLDHQDMAAAVRTPAGRSPAASAADDRDEPVEVLRVVLYRTAAVLLFRDAYVVDSALDVVVAFVVVVVVDASAVVASASAVLASVAVAYASDTADAASAAALAYVVAYVDVVVEDMAVAYRRHCPLRR